MLILIIHYTVVYSTTTRLHQHHHQHRPRHRRHRHHHHRHRHVQLGGRVSKWVHERVSEWVNELLGMKVGVRVALITRE